MEMNADLNGFKYRNPNFKYVKSVFKVRLIFIISKFHAYKNMIYSCRQIVPNLFLIKDIVREFNLFL